ncbi:MAG: 1-aminocyclopropane-1-carboxylate deaminase [Micavibrio sp.]|nr:1-aminocyclopropane-1-carboxylate deaminase [Micavibrio sp.]|tara:strand:+ start:1347 stop:2534 length:1188 start_codon:yes stop_codon:yes gene_type:complete
MALKTSERSDIETFRALDNLRTVNEKISRGNDIIRLEAGQPCFGAPQAALDYAAKCLINDPIQGYTDAIGMISLRQRIADYYKDYYSVHVTPEQINITSGSSPGFIMAFLTAFNPGDKIALCTPTYAAYKNIIKSMDLQITEIQTNADTNFQPTLDLLKNAAEKFDGIIINSPSNPTGTILDEDEFSDICNWCDEQGIRIVSDEAYHRITYGTKAQTALKFSNNAIIMNTFSKFFAMTGWRLGWVISPPDMVKPMKKLAESLFVAPPTISQHVAYKIFDHLDELDNYVLRYKENHDILRDLLPAAGLNKLSKGDGAFYFYVDVSDFTNDSEDFCHRLVEEAGVSVTAGLDFDGKRGHQYIRLSYAGSADDMREACQRIKIWLTDNQAGNRVAKTL